MKSIQEIAEGLTTGAARAVRKMSADWQFCGKATFDANGAWNAARKADPELQAVLAEALSRDRDASLAEDAKRLSPEGVAARPEGIAHD